MTTTEKQFKKAFPEYADYTKEDSIAFIASFKKEKRDSDKWMTKRVNYYGNRIK